MAARRRLLRWGSWFALVNAGVLALVGLRYQLFGCSNPPADYASGQSLFSDGQWEWLITLSHNFALLEPDQVTIVYPSGNEVRDQSYRLVQHPRLSRDKLRAAMQEMSRFFN